MANERLGTKNIEQLLNQYRSERKRLFFQLRRVRETITHLKTIRAKEVKAETGTLVKRGPGRPRKDEGLEVVKRGPGRPRKNPESGEAPAKIGRRRRRTGGYRLSPWDQAVIEAIKKEGLLPKQIILDRVRSWVKDQGMRMSGAEIEVKVTRVLQKLSGSRGLLGTYRSGQQRGYHYGLKEWFFASSGALRKQHLSKMVMLPE